MAKHLFKKGASGNPTWRPGGFAEFTQLCRDKATAALARIEKLAFHTDARVRLDANTSWSEPGASR
jgi:hypothetical protein